LVFHLSFPPSRLLRSYEVNGVKYRRGDNVYVVMTEDSDLLPDEDAEDTCACCSKEATGKRGLLECDRCLAGYHLDCLVPALKKVPEVRLKKGWGRGGHSI
jgi:origin recognition complex subunit 1